MEKYGSNGNDVMTGGANDDALYGLDGDDTLRGGFGEDTLYGGQGADVYEIRDRDGLTEIFDDGLAGDADTLRFIRTAEVYAPDVSVFRSGLDLFITGAGADVVVRDWYAGEATRVEQVEFSDGVSWSVADIFRLTNHAPVAGAPLVEQWVTAGQLFQFFLPADAFVDVDAVIGDRLSYTATLADGTALPDWLRFDAATQTFAGMPVAGEVGQLQIRVVATDSHGASASSDFALEVEAAPTAPGVPFERRVNTDTTGSQYYPEIAVMQDGYVVVYESKAEGTFDIYAQRYFFDGRPNGLEFRVNTLTELGQYYPAVDSMSDGGFVVTWNSYVGNGRTISAQRYGADGIAMGDELLINGEGKYVWMPEVAGGGDGSYVVAWHGSGAISSRAVDAFGVMGEEVVLFSQPGSDVRGTNVANLFEQKYIITWCVNEWPPGNIAIRGRTYDAATNELGPIIDFGESVPLPASYSAVESIGDDRYVVAWAATDSYVSRIYAEVRTFAGDVVKPAFVVGDGDPSSANVPEIASLGDDGFVISWEGRLDGVTNLYAQHFDRQGLPLDGAFRLNEYTTSSPGWPNIEGLPNGGFVAAWENTEQDGSAYGIYAQQYDDSGAPLFTANAQVGSDFDDVMDFTASAFDVTVIGGAGDDFLAGGVGNDQLYGGQGNDLLQGGAGDDMLLAGNGFDVLYGGLGNDLLIGDNGTFEYSSGNTYVFFGGDGLDRIFEAGYGESTLKIVLSEGAAADDVLFTASVAEGLVITFSGSTDRIDIPGQYGAGSQWSRAGGVELIEIRSGSEDGTILDSYAKSVIDGWLL